MSQRARTKDELFILRLHDLTIQTGELDTPFDRYEVGRSVGLAAKAVDTICTALAQANFIKKIDKVDIRLTTHGEQLALRLKNEQ